MPKGKHPVVRLAIDREAPVGEIIIYSRHVQVMQTGNPWVPSPLLALSVLESDTDALVESHTISLGGGQGLAEARNSKLAKVLSDLDLLRAGVQVVVDANVSRCDEIAQSCGFVIGKSGQRNKAQLAAYSTNEPGTVKLVARAVRRGAAYSWEMSTDGGNTWIPVGITTLPDTTVPGLTRGKEYHFRFRSTVGRVTSKPCDAVRFIVVY